jgi:ElaB/YqjD/DUF883 family membrane-anchored ribosome-binding protein
MIMTFEDQKSRAGAAIQSATSNVKQEATDLQSSISRGASDVAENVSSKLKSIGVDTDVMVDMAKDKATDLQKLLMSELKDRPMRSLGIAAAVGLLFGYMSSR